MLLIIILWPPPLDPYHHAEHQSQKRGVVCQSSDGGSYGHMEPDPGPLGLYPAEESSSEENLHVAVQMPESKVSSPAPLAAQCAPQLNRNKHLSYWPV